MSTQIFHASYHQKCAKLKIYSAAKIIYAWPTSYFRIRNSLIALCICWDSIA